LPNPLEPTPNQGDVLFTDDLDLGAALSGYVQSRIDPLARNANETFEHVAIAIDDSFALEAMPAKKLIATAGAALFKAKAGSPWSGVKLEAGTRIAPSRTFSSLHGGLGRS
jgi:hypothetical protein